MDRCLILTVFWLTLLRRVSGAPYDEERALERLANGGGHLNQRGISSKMGCKKEGYECRGVPSCCGTLVCYWEGGFSLRKDGECVRCVQEGQVCQRDSQCCPNFQCDKASLLSVDGLCARYRRTGKCYRDGQCVTDCRKKWYKMSGQCS